MRGIFLGVGGETPDAVAERAKIAVERGYTALKFTPMPREFQTLKYSVLVDNAIDMLAAVRETVGNDFDIGIEIHRNMRPSEDVVFCEKAMPFNPYFIEDPIVPDGVLAMSEVAAKMRLPLAVGERNTGIYEFREYAQMTNCSFFKPDIAVAGGITGVKKISAIAEAHHILIAPHNFQGPIATAACVQLGISSPAWDVLEAVDEDKPPRSDMVDVPMEGGRRLVHAPGKARPGSNLQRKCSQPTSIRTRPHATTDPRRRQRRPALNPAQDPLLISPLQGGGELAHGIRQA